MVGGEVIETIRLTRRHSRGVDNLVWINCAGTGCERGSKCAIYVYADDKARCVDVGDSIWWQGGNAYWAPKKNAGVPRIALRAGIDYDIVLDRCGYSGVSRPPVEDGGVWVLSPDDE